jgi:uncharacterized protein YdhG (YjbR/CyaY superfamily)
MRPPSATVDDFLASQPDDVRAALEDLRRAIRAAVPEVTEAISYGVPSFRYRGRSLVSFGAAKDHCSFYVMSPAVMEAHRDELAPYDTAKGTVHFPANRPLPDALVEKLVRARIEENEAMAARRRA